MRLARLFLCLTILLSGCALPFLKKNPEQVLAEEQSAVLHLLYGGHGSCSAFYIGSGLFISAAHCLMGYPMDADKIRLIDSRDFQYSPELIAVDLRRDLVLLKLDRYNGKQLELWDSKIDGPMPLGMELMGMGYPSYFGLDFTFDISQLRAVAKNSEGVQCILARDLSFPGYSGGPIISMNNGKVVGVTHVMVDTTKYYDSQHHIGAWISIAISASELQDWLRELGL